MKYKHLGHLAFNVSDMDAALKFYCEGLGLKIAFSMTFDPIYQQLQKDIAAGTVPSWMDGEKALKEMELRRELPWLIYLQAAPGQFIELFYTYDGETLLGDTSHNCGYQHLCLEVDNIQNAWEEITGNGIQPTSQINQGPDGSKQFWVADPDGNRIEIMQYTEKSLQVICAVEE